jgi:hypothetical protein
MAGQPTPLKDGTPHHYGSIQVGNIIPILSNKYNFYQLEGLWLSFRYTKCMEIRSLILEILK